MATALALLTLDARDFGPIEQSRGLAVSAITSLWRAADAAVEPVRTSWEGVTHYGELRDERDRLLAEVDRLEGGEGEAGVARDELRAVLEQHDIPWVGDIPRVVAEVVSGPTSNFSHSIQIGKGSTAGIRLGMPVVSGAGLIGRIQQVTPSRSVVQLLTDPGFRVGVKLLPSGPFGTSSGRGEGHTLVVDTSMGNAETVTPGTVLVTSGGDGSRYPRSIPVGTLRGSRRAGNGLTLDLLVEPFVDPLRVTFVTVLLTAEPRG